MVKVTWLIIIDLKLTFPLQSDRKSISKHLVVLWREICEHAHNRYGPKMTVLTHANSWDFLMYWTLVSFYYLLTKHWSSKLVKWSLLLSTEPLISRLLYLQPWTLDHKFPLSITCMLFSYDRGILVTYVSSHWKPLLDNDSNAFQCLPSWIRRSEDDAWRSVRLRRR